MSLKIELKLFKVTKTESGWNWSREYWIKYYLAPNEELVKDYVRQEHGELDKYYYEEEEHIEIEELDVKMLDESMVRGHADDYDEW